MDVIDQYSKYKSLPSHSEGNTLYYVTPIGLVLCSKCAENAIKEYLHDARHLGDTPNSIHVYWEGSMMYCDECNHLLKPVYGNPDYTDEENNEMFDMKCECRHCRDLTIP
jgi:hypothetical protein